MWKAFKELGWRLPWGNDGRGMVIYLWPFVGVGLFVLAVLWLG